MKKTIIIAVFIAATAVSCKKDRTCTCTSSTNGGTASTSTNVIKKTTKKAALSSTCASYTDTYISGGTTYVKTRTCTLQ